jgi:histidyl-tRNA synthetase
MKQQPTIPSGTRDFNPEVMQKREYIFQTIKSVFRLHGYQQIETPSMENISTLLGKYGDEGDKLLFRILNSGDFLSKLPESVEKSLNSKDLLPYISDKGLRYDLTVPFARFVVMNRNDLQFPFKRYQIQAVWRADRPQRGRYREFYQCDVDVIGSDSLLNEFELVQMIDQVFEKLNINACLLINNRKVLDGILHTYKLFDKLNVVAIAIDKLDKVGKDIVLKEMIEKGIDAEAADAILSLVQTNFNQDELFSQLEKLLKDTDVGMKGLEEVKELFRYIKNANIAMEVKFDLSLARGLDYYTGSIFEVKAKDVQIGSICGGGRYDNLTAYFGLPDMSGVGVSFGADRIYDVMSELNLFPESIHTTSSVLFVNFGKDELDYIFPLFLNLQKESISSEIYSDNHKMKKQLNYADKKKIPFVVLAGQDEIAQNLFVLKNMQTGEQLKLSKGDLIKYLKDNL